MEYWPPPAKHDRTSSSSRESLGTSVEEDGIEEQASILLDGYEAPAEQAGIMAEQFGMGSPDLKSGLTDDFAKMALATPKKEATNVKPEIVEIGDSPMDSKDSRAQKVLRLEFLKKLN